MGSVSTWEAIFMLVVLKIPMIYLGAVVLWAIRAQPEPGGGFEPVRALVPLTPCGWDEWKRRRPVRRPLRPAPRPSPRPRVRAAA